VNKKFKDLNLKKVKVVVT